VRDEALFEILDQIITRVYYHADGIVPFYGSIGTIGDLRFHFRRHSDGPIHRLTRWPSTDWQVVFEMDFLEFVRTRKPSVSHLREIEGPESFMRDMIYAKMVISGE